MKKIVDLTQKEIGVILDNIEYEKSYYAGGSLCVDNVIPKNKGILILRLNERFGDFCEKGSSFLNKENSIKIFRIYKKYKGETEYFKDKLAQSSVTEDDL